MTFVQIGGRYTPRANWNGAREANTDGWELGTGNGIDAFG